MGRPRGFDEQDVVAAAARLFTRLGYEATSVDDLVGATGLHRGSLYKAFGSKRGIFLAALHRSVDHDLPARLSDPVDPPGPALDLLLVACLELAPHDDEVRALVGGACRLLDGRAPGAGRDGTATLLGRRLLDRARLTPSVTTDPREVFRP